MGCDLSQEEGFTLLGLAVSEGQLPMVKWLLDRNASPNTLMVRSAACALSTSEWPRGLRA